MHIEEEPVEVEFNNLHRDMNQNGWIFLTNFPAEQFDLYRKAIDIYNQKYDMSYFIILDYAEDDNGNKHLDYKSLWHDGKVNPYYFYGIFYMEMSTRCLNGDAKITSKQKTNNIVFIDEKEMML